MGRGRRRERKVAESLFYIDLGGHGWQFYFGLEHNLFVIS